MAKNKHFGMSAYAGMHPKFPVKRFMDQYPDSLKNGCISFLSGSFGWSSKLVEAFAARFPTGVIEVHMGNGCGRRGKFEKGDFAPEYGVRAYDEAILARKPKLLKKIEKRLSRIYETVFDIAPSCQHVLCIELEDNMKDAAAAALCGIIRRMRPDLSLVRNPCTGSKAPVKSTYYEKHGVTYNGQPVNILNMDGISLDAKDGSKFFQKASESTVKRMLDSSNAYATMIWSARQQGYPNLQNWVTKPPKRSRTFEVSDQEIAMVRKLLGGR